MEYSHETQGKFAAERAGLITGSKCSILFPTGTTTGKGMATYAKELAQQKFFQFYDVTRSWQTEHGEINETGGAELYAETFNVTLDRPPFAWDPLHQLGGTGDFVCGFEYGIDIKSPTTLANFVNYHYEDLDKDQIHQGRMYAHLYQVPRWFIVAYLQETERMIEAGDQYPIPYGPKRLIVKEVPMVPGWAELLQERAKPLITQRDQYVEILKRKFAE